MDTNFRNFYLAIKHENMEEIKKLLPLVDISAYDNVALEIAVGTDNFDTICLLLSLGAKEEGNFFDEYLISANLKHLKKLWDLGVRGYAPLAYKDCQEKDFFIKHGSKIPKELEEEFVSKLFLPPYQDYQGYEWSETLQKLLDKKFNCFPYVVHDNLIEKLKKGDIDEVIQSNLHDYHKVENLEEIFDAIEDKLALKNYLKKQDVNSLIHLNKSQLQAIFKINKEFHTLDKHSSYSMILPENYEEIIPYILNSIEPNIVFLLNLANYCPENKLKSLFSKFDEYVIDYLLFKKPQLRGYLSSINEEAIFSINYFNLEVIKKANIKSPGLLLAAIAEENDEAIAYLAQYTKTDAYLFRFLNHFSKSEYVIKALKIFEQRGIEFNILNFDNNEVASNLSHLDLPKEHLFNLDFCFPIQKTLEKKVVNAYLNDEIKFNNPLIIHLNDYSDSDTLKKVVDCDIKNGYFIKDFSLIKNLEVIRYILNQPQYQNETIHLHNFYTLNSKEIHNLIENNKNPYFDNLCKLLSFQNNSVQFLDNLEGISFSDILYASYKINTNTMMNLLEHFTEKEIIKTSILHSREDIIDLFKIMQEKHQLSNLEGKAYTGSLNRITEKKRKI